MNIGVPVTLGSYICTVLSQPHIYKSTDATPLV
jgi:hypothetical protein